MNDTRVFFVTDSTEDNEELHETLEQAQAYTLSAMSEPQTARIRICMVLHAFPEGRRWNYDDQDNTFVTVKTIDF